MAGVCAILALALIGGFDTPQAAREAESRATESPSPSLANFDGEDSPLNSSAVSAAAGLDGDELILRRRDSLQRRLQGRLWSAAEGCLAIKQSPMFFKRWRIMDFAGVSDLASAYPPRLQDLLFAAAADTAVDKTRQAAADSFIKNIEIGYSSPLGDRDGSISFDIFWALWESQRALVFGQTGAILQERTDDWEPGGNAGLGVRFLTADWLQLGGNIFFDHLSDEDDGRFQRYSIGIEARTRYVDLSANTYRRLSDVRFENRESGRFAIYTAEGYDIEAAGRIPGYEWLEFGIRRYEWERLNSKDLEGFNYRAALQLYQPFSLEVEYDEPEEGDSDWSVNFNFAHSWAPGDGHQGLFRRSAKPGGRDIWSRRYEKVRRRYEQRIIEESVEPLLRALITRATRGPGESINSLPPLTLAPVARGGQAPFAVHLSQTPAATVTIEFLVSPLLLPEDSVSSIATLFDPDAGSCTQTVTGDSVTAAICSWEVRPSPPADNGTGCFGLRFRFGGRRMPIGFASGYCRRYFAAG